MSYSRPAKDHTLRISLIAALGGLLFGYDTAVISGAIGFLETHFELSAAGVGWAASSALAGCIPGALGAGWLNHALGRRVTLQIAAVLFLISAIGSAIPEHLSTFIIFRIIGGVGVGIASFTSPLYIAEVSAPECRGKRVSLNQFAIIFGMLMVYFVNYGIALQGDEAWNVNSGWRWMFASECLPAVIFLLGLLTIPESPRWLALRGREDEALRVLTKVCPRSEQAAEVLAEIRASLGRTQVRFRELFAKPWSRPLAIGIALAVLQQATGINVFLYYAPEIFKNLGASTDVALLQTIVVGCVNLLFTVIAIKNVDRWGRKPLLLWGSAGMGISLLAIGLGAHFDILGAWALVFILGYIACFALSMGPVVWVVLSEIFPNRLRGAAIALATFALWIANFIVSQTFPMMDRNSWLVDHFNHGFPFYLYALMCLVTVILVKSSLPETKTKSLEEIEASWQRQP